MQRKQYGQLMWSILLTWINVNLSNYMHYNMWDENYLSIPKLHKGATVDVWEWISNFNPHFTGYVVTIHAGIEVNPCQQKGPNHHCVQCT